MGRTPAIHSSLCGTLFWDALAEHSCGRLLWDALVGHKRQSQCDCAENCPSHKTLCLRSESILHTSSSHVVTRFLAISHESDTLCFHPKPSPTSPNVSAIALHLRTVAVAATTTREQGSTLHYTHSEKNDTKKKETGTILFKFFLLLLVRHLFLVAWHLFRP